MTIKRQVLIGGSGYSPIHYALANQANSAGGGAGQTVSISYATFFQDQYGNPQLPDPANYSVAVCPSQSAIGYVTGKTNSGFSVVLSPIPTTATLAASTFDVIVSG
jgi:hypothetical protein